MAVRMKQTLMATFFNTEARVCCCASCCARFFLSDSEPAALLEDLWHLMDQDLRSWWSHIGMVKCIVESLFRELRGGGYVVLWDTIFFQVDNTAARCTFFLLTGLYYDSAVILPAGRMVSAGCTMVLLVVILPAARLVSAGCTMVLLGVVPAATTQPADDPDSAGGSSFHPAGSTPMSGSAVPD
ncbi:hypothetical protein Tco_1307402, partial [Tanacetum coccineum]